ncbi:MAG TPA: BrnT family toxin [Pyrinomonadaceae bacterium]|nr:BrnT family toxin [Pyrinomonadaceae bacterium]HMP65895.1 BrnT family toxin [Pyrinomonadaceae bacterium]
MEFEWDPRKAAANLRKHGVSFDEAAEAFFDENAFELYDDSHSEKELRFQIIGLSRSQLLFVGYTVRGETIRIITARKANARQARYYNEQNR